MRNYLKWKDIHVPNTIMDKNFNLSTKQVS